MNEIKTISKGAFWILLGFGYSKIATLIFRILSARFFGVESYGNFVISFTIFSAVSLISVFGLPFAIEYFIPRVKKSVAKGVFVESALISIGLSTILCSILLLFSSNLADVFNVTDYLMFVIFLLVAPLGALAEVLSSVFRAYRNVKWEVLYKRVLIQTGIVVMLILFYLLNTGTISIALSFVVSYIIATLIMVYIVNYHIFGGTRYVKFDVSRLVRYSLPLSLSLMMLFLMTWEDNLIVSYFLGPKFAGLYGSAAPISQVLILPSSMFSIILLPVLSNIVSKRKYKDLNKSLQFSMKWTVLSSLAFAVPLMLFSELLLSLLFGSAFASASTALSILVIGYILFGVFQVLSRVLMSYGKTDYYLLASIISVISNFILNVALVPVLGINGAAIGTSVSMFILVSLVYSFVKMDSNIKICSRELLLGILSLLLPSVLLYFAAVTFGSSLVLALAALASYFLLLFILLFLFGVLTNDEISVLKTLLTKLNRRKL